MRISTLDIYPSGKAAKANHVPMVPFAPNPDYAGIAEAAGCAVYRVEKADELMPALEKAMEWIQQHKKQVVLNVKIGMDDGEK